MRDGRTYGRRTREDKATQPLDAGRLSFAKRTKFTLVTDKKLLQVLAVWLPGLGRNIFRSPCDFHVGCCMRRPEKILNEENHLNGDCKRTAKLERQQNSHQASKLFPIHQSPPNPTPPKNYFLSERGKLFEWGLQESRQVGQTKKSHPSKLFPTQLSLLTPPKKSHPPSLLPPKN